MTNKTEMNEKENKNHHFQVRYILNTGLNINKDFREQVESNLDLTFSSKTIINIRIVLSKDNNPVLSLLIFY